MLILRQYWELTAISYGEKLQPLLMSLPEDKRTLALTFQQEALSLALQQIHTARHATDCAAKNISTAVVLKKYAWLRSPGISPESRS